jgi:hypothetical protein
MEPVADDYGDLLARLQRWDRECTAHWSKWDKEARELFDAYAGRQWSDTELERLREFKRVPITINRFASIIDAVAGAEITDRQEVQYLPREVGDSGVNDLLTQGAEWIRDMSDAGFEESEAYKDALICGMGCTETRMDYSEEPEGKVAVDRVDPLEIKFDPKARKANALDARYIRRRKIMDADAAKEMFPGALFAGVSGKPTESVNNPRDDYEEDPVERPGENEVEVKEYQWWELQTAAMIATPEGEMILDGEELAALEQELSDQGLPFTGVKIKRRRYWRTFVSGEEILSNEPLELEEFTYKFLTGKRDRNKGTYFGLGRLMMDPQRWANGFFTQIYHILSTSAKGGIVADAAAVEDVKKFEATWARSDAVTWMNPGPEGLGAAVQPKPVPAYPQGLDRLMTLSIEGIQDATGVNKELLGMTGREQAGILEHQRKQAAYGILASFFDGLRRYRRAQGRLMLKLIQRYLPDDTLVRITGDNGVAQYVPLVREPDTARFDVVVDDAPAGPNQKQQTFALLTQLMPMLQNAGLPPDFWAEIARYSPLPTPLAEKLAQSILQAGERAVEQPDPMALQEQMAEVQKTQADAEEKLAKADKTRVETALMTAPAPVIPIMG